MGLDMSFYERHWLPPQQNKRGNYKRPSFSIPTKPYGNDRKRFENVAYITCNVGYFRKANAIHKWIIDKCGVDEFPNQADGMDLILDKADILELKEICLKLLGVPRYKFKKMAKELLPTADGFFWGSTEYDKWYRKDLRDFIKLANRLHLDDPYIDIIYNANW